METAKWQVEKFDVEKETEIGGKGEVKYKGSVYFRRHLDYCRIYVEGDIAEQIFHQMDDLVLAIPLIPDVETPTTSKGLV